MRNPKNMLIVGIVLLVVGVGILLFNPDQSAANLEIARNAKNAQEAAAAISGNNQRELMIHMAGNFLAGIGIALTAGGFFLKRKKQSLSERRDREHPLSPCLFFYAWESSGWLSFREICYTDKK